MGTFVREFARPWRYAAICAPPLAVIGMVFAAAHGDPPVYGLGAVLMAVAFGTVPALIEVSDRRLYGTSSEAAWCGVWAGILTLWSASFALSAML